MRRKKETFDLKNMCENEKKGHKSNRSAYANVCERTLKSFSFI